MPITVPKPITNPSPVQVTHSPYDPTGMLFPKSSSIPQPLPVGTITGMFPNPASAAKPPAAPIPTPASNFYTPAKQSNVTQYLNQLKAGWSLNPQTGQIVSPAQMLGKAGGPSLSSYLAHKGMLDPASAQAALNQFKASGGVTDPYNIDWGGGPSGGYYAMQRGAGAPTPEQPTNYFDPSSTDPRSQSVRDALNQLANTLVSGGGNIDTAAKQQIAQNLSQPGMSDAFARALATAETYKAVNSPKPPGAVSFINGQWVGPQANVPPPSATSAATYYNPSANLPGYDPNARITPGWKPQPKK